MGCGTCGKTIAQTLIKGSVGLSKVAANNVLGTSIDKASNDTIKQRRDICRDCPEATKNPKLLDKPSKGLTTFSRCLHCKCFIAAKTQVASEHCPLEKW